MMHVHEKDASGHTNEILTWPNEARNQRMITLITHRNISSLYASMQRASGADAVRRALATLLPCDVETTTVLALQRPAHAESCADLSKALDLLEVWKKWFFEDLEARGDTYERDMCRQIIEQGRECHVFCCDPL